MIIGIDLGTTNIKVCAYDSKGRQVADSSRKTTIVYHRNGWCEFDVEAIWNNVFNCLREVASSCGDTASAIGVSSFGESNVLLDSDGKPVYPMIAWFDTRCAEEARRLTKSLSPEEIHSLTGQFVSPKMGICKTMWIQHNQPEAYSRAVCCLTMLDYIIFRLTGVENMDYTMGSRMMLLDVHTLEYADPIIAASGLRRELFPPVRPSGSAVAPVSPALARAVGLRGDVLVFAGGHDHSCSAIATHVFDDDVALDSMGTAETLLVAADTLPDFSRCFRNQVSIYPHLGKKLYRMTTSIQACGASLYWADCHLLGGGAEDSELKVLKELLAAALADPKAGRPIFCPNIRGLQEAPYACGAFFGITDVCTKEDLAYVVAEGLCFEAYRRLEGCLSAMGAEIMSLRVVGGPSRLEELTQMKADIFGHSIHVPIIHDAACLGAALVAGLGAGVLNELPELQIEREYTPNPDAVKGYRERYPLYRRALDLVLKY